MSIFLRNIYLLAACMPMIPVADGFVARGTAELPSGISRGPLSLCLSRVTGDCSLINKRMFFPWKKNTLPCSLIGRNL